MKNLSDVPPEDNPTGDEIESPVDGPTPDWMRLATSSNKGSSLSEANTPAWLKAIRSGQGISKESTPSESKPAPASTPSEGGGDDGMSDLERLLAEEGIDLSSVSEERPEGAKGKSARDWLIETSTEEMIRNRVGAEPASEEPASSPSLPAEAASSDETMSDLERLLAEEGIDLSSVSEERPEAAGGMSARDWLIASSDDEMIRRKVGAEPMAEAISQSVSSSSDDKMVVEEDLPDWLREVDEESAPASPTPQPAMLDDDKIVDEENLPDWLREISDEAPGEPEAEIQLPQPPEAVETAPVATFAHHDPMVVEEDLPDWLQEIADEPTPAGPLANEDRMVVEADLPDWLREVADESATTDLFDTQAELGAGEDLPDWLRDVADESTSKEPSVVAAERDQIVVEEDLPDWLREVEEDSLEPALAFDETKLEAAPASIEMVAEEDLPDWLREVEASSTDEEVLLPQLEPALEPTTGRLGDEIVEEEDLPDWLKEVQEREVEAEELVGLPPKQEQATDFVTPLPTPTTAMIDEEDLPDWLKEVQEEDLPLPTFEPERVAGFEPEEEGEATALPEWLQEVQEGEEDEIFEPSEPSPEPFADILSEEELVIAEELPDWLQEVQDEEAEVAAVVETPAPAPVAVSPAAAQADLVDEEGLPDWLRGIEEELEEAEEAEELPAEEPVFPAPESVPVSGLPPYFHEATVEEAAPQLETVTGGEVPVKSNGEKPSQVDRLDQEEKETPSPFVTPVMASSPGLPDWLRKLRESDLEEEEVAPPAPSPTRPARTPAPQRKPVAKIEPQREVTPLMVEPEADLPADAAERLKLARTARDKGELEEAVRVYGSLVTHGIYLDEIIEDMQQAIRTYPSNFLLLQLMGDAMMRDGRLQGALTAYREALTNL